MKNAVILLLFLLLLQPFHSLAASTNSQQRDTLALEVFQMTQSLEELVQLLKTQQARNDEFQKLQAAISYLSFRSRSIEMMQYELRFKKERRDAVEAQIARIEDDPDNWDKFDKRFSSNQAVTTSSDPRPSEMRIKVLKGSLKDMNSEIATLEAEIQTSKDELASFESYIQGKLNLIQ